MVAAVREGDDAAFGALYRRHHAHVTALIGGMVRDRARVEDLVQDAFVSALRRMRATDAEIHFRAWISEIARNASIDHYRRTSRTREVSFDAESGLPAPDARRLGTAPSPDQAALGRERFGHLRGALDELTDTHQRVIVLRELEGHSYHEIGELMDLTPSGVESTLFRARRRLEHEYTALDTGERCRDVQRAIGAMTEGAASRREVGRVRRHVVRCAACAHHARLQGVDTTGRLARVAALLPIPLLVERRRTGLVDTLRGMFSANGAAAPSLAPSSFDQAAPVVGKALAVAAAAFAIGHGPAASDHARDAGRQAAAAPHATIALPTARSAHHRAGPASPDLPARSGPATATPKRSATAPPAARAEPVAPARPDAGPARVTPRTPARSQQPPTAARPTGSVSAPEATTTAGSASAIGRVAQSPPAETGGGAVKGVTDTLEQAVPSEVAVPATGGKLAPRQTVHAVDATVRRLLGQ